VKKQSKERVRACLNPNTAAASSLKAKCVQNAKIMVCVWFAFHSIAGATILLDKAAFDAVPDMHKRSTFHDHHTYG
jgi:hypothetical protein